MIRAIFCFLFITTNAFASSIVAKVDDVPISKYDLESYIKMVLVTSQINPTAEEIKKIEASTLDQLIEQTVRLNSIANANISISDEQINEAIYNIEKQSNAEQGSLQKLLGSQNIPESILQNKLRADIGWFQLLNMQFGKNISVSNAEIDLEIEKLKKSTNKPMIHLQEIFIPVPSVLQDNDIYYQTLDLIKTIKDNGNFEQYAKQYSHSASKSNGGNVGWLPMDSIPSEFTDKIKDLNTGDISDPIRTVEGYYIIMIKDKKNAQDNEQNISRTRIEDLLRNKKLEQFSRKYLRDMMHKSIIEKTGQ